MNSNSKSFKGALLIIGLLVIVGIYLLVEKEVSNTQTPVNENTSEESFNFSPLTGDERAALNAPKSAASEQAIFAHAEAVHKIAVATDSVVVGAECRTSPAAVKIAKGKSLNFKNYDSIAHTIIFDATHSVVVPANGNASLTLSFGEPLHIYGYGCELSENPVGMVLIAE